MAEGVSIKGIVSFSIETITTKANLIKASEIIDKQVNGRILVGQPVITGIEFNNKAGNSCIKGTAEIEIIIKEKNE
jgi:hypothetical protein